MTLAIRIALFGLAAGIAAFYVLAAFWLVGSFTSSVTLVVFSKPVLASITAMTILLIASLLLERRRPGSAAKGIRKPEPL